MHRIAGPRIVRERQLSPEAIDELDLVDDDAGLKQVSLGDDEKPVEHSPMRLRFGGGEDDDDLIHIRGDNALALTCARRTTCQL